MADPDALTEELTERLGRLEARCRQLEMEKAVLLEALAELQQAITSTANHAIRIGQFLGQGAPQPQGGGRRDGDTP